MFRGEPLILLACGALNNRSGDRLQGGILAGARSGFAMPKQFIEPPSREERQEKQEGLTQSNDSLPEIDLIDAPRLVL